MDARRRRQIAGGRVVDADVDVVVGTAGGHRVEFGSQRLGRVHEVGLLFSELVVEELQTQQVVLVGGAKLVAKADHIEESPKRGAVVGDRGVGCLCPSQGDHSSSDLRDERGARLKCDGALSGGGGAAGVGVGGELAGKWDRLCQRELKPRHRVAVEHGVHDRDAAVLDADHRIGPRQRGERAFVEGEGSRGSGLHFWMGVDNGVDEASLGEGCGERHHHHQQDHHRSFTPGDRRDPSSRWALVIDM